MQYIKSVKLQKRLKMLLTVYNYINNGIRVKSLYKFITFYSYSGEYSKREIPRPISNLEVKPLSADDTAPCRCGKVGLCRDKFFLLK